MAMSEAHKKALARGRNDARAVKAYLDALQSRKPGRKASPETLKKRVAELDRKIDREESQLAKLQLIQQRRDAEAKLKSSGPSNNFASLETGFVKVAKRYSESKGISYGAWREIGVPAATLKKAGISRGQG